DGHCDGDKSNGPPAMPLLLDIVMVPGHPTPSPLRDASNARDIIIVYDSTAEDGLCPVRTVTCVRPLIATRNLWNMRPVFGNNCVHCSHQKLKDAFGVLRPEFIHVTMLRSLTVSC